MLPGRNSAGSPGGALRGLCSFSGNGEHYALTSGSGIVKVFDTVTGALHQQVGFDESSKEGHLGANYRCLGWASNSPKTPGKSKKKTAAAGKPGNLLVLGGSTGEVSAWNTALGELAWRVPACHSGEVCSVAFSSATSTLFSAGEDAQVCELSVGSGEVNSKWKAGKHPISAMAASPDGTRLLVGSSTLSLWDVASRERLAKFSGHSVPALGVCFSPQGSLAVSAAPTEKHIAVWACDPSATKMRKGAVGVLSMEHPAVQLSTSLATSSPSDSEEDHSGAFHTVAISEVGEAYVWRCSSKGPAEASWRIRVSAPASGMPSSECVLAARPSEAGAGLLLVRGSSAKPTFTQLTLPKPTGTKAAAVVLLEAAEETGMLLNNHNAPGTPGTAARTAQNVTMLDAQAAVLRPSMNGQKEEKRKRKGAEEEDGEEGGREGDVAMAIGGEETEEGEGELSLGERLAQLGVEGEDALNPRGQHRGGASGEGLPKADSLGVLLTQAVRAEDRVLLERCLSVADDAIVTNTVMSLKPSDALTLLEALLLRLQARPGRGLQLARWIRAVCLGHAGYLMSAPGAAPHLTALYQILEARLSLMRPLLSLSGRLDLLLSQQAQSHRSSSQATGSSRGPVVDYTEPETGDDDIINIEDPFAVRTNQNEDDDEEEWETDDENSDGMQYEEEDVEDDYEE